MLREMFVTVGTGRDREDIGKALALSIRHHRADRVWCLVTSKSQDETLPVIRRELGTEGPPLEPILIEDENDAENCQRQFQRAIAARVAAGCRAADMAVDYTSGTKAMSAGLFAAAVAMGVETISYIAGRRDAGGRVMPGTERFTSFAPRALFAQRELEQATWLFDRYRFEEAAAFAARAGRCGDPDIAARAQILAPLAEAFGDWDRFDHESAFRRLNSLGGDVRLEAWGMRGAVERGKQFLYRAREKGFPAERLADLVANARRRLREGKYDDAVARGYRAYEYLAQWRQDALGLNPVDLRWEALQARLPAERQHAWRGRTEVEGRLRLGLRQDYELLRDLGDPLGVAFCAAYAEEDSTLRKRLEQRNASILAHGTAAVGREAAEELLELLERCARGQVERWDWLVAAATFPRLAGDRSPGVDAPRATVS